MAYFVKADLANGNTIVFDKQAVQAYYSEPGDKTMVILNSGFQFLIVTPFARFDEEIDPPQPDVFIN